MFDTHAHLTSSRLLPQVGEIVQGAIQQDFKGICVPGSDEIDSKRAVELSMQYSLLYCSVGIHPANASKYKSEEESLTALRGIEELLNTERYKSKIVAIGEIGLDGNYANTPEKKKRQLLLLRKQFRLAETYKKSIIIHGRGVACELVGELKKEWLPYHHRRVVLHCCEAENELLDFAKRYAGIVGVDGDITFNQAKVEFIKNVPLDMLVLETDSPYLLPEPLRSEKKYPNTPLSLPLIARAVAEAKGISVSEVVSVTTKNARELFALPF